AEGIGLQRVVLTELLLQALILVWGKRSGQVMVAKGEVLAANQIRGKGMTVVGQVTQQTAEQDQIQLAGCVAERRPLLAEKGEPAQQMRIATQLGGLMQVGEVGVKVSKESMHTRAIFLHRARPEGGGKPLNLGFQDLVQGRWQSLHGILRSEEHTSELQSRENLVCRLLLEKKKKKNRYKNTQENRQ